MGLRLVSNIGVLAGDRIRRSDGENLIKFLIFNHRILHIFGEGEPPYLSLFFSHKFSPQVKYIVFPSKTPLIVHVDGKGWATVQCTHSAAGRAAEQSGETVNLRDEYEYLK